MPYLCLEIETAPPAPPAASRADMAAWLLEENARRPDPLPICPGCDCMFQSGDAGWLDPTRCCSCEAEWIDKQVRRLLFGRTRKARKRALKRLKRAAR